MRLRKLSAARKIQAAFKYIRIRLQGGPILVNLEVTHYCNATCDFCDFWKTRNGPNLQDYVAIIKRLNPFVVTLSGGEPLINKHLPEVVRNIRENTGFLYLSMVTNGSLLTVEKAQALWEAGIDQITISVNYLGDKLDRERGIPGLFDHIATLVPKLTAQGMNLVLNTVIMQENLEQVTEIARQAQAWGAKVSYSSYTDFKNGNRAHLIEAEFLSELDKKIQEIMRLKRELKNILNSDFYLQRILQYFRREIPASCKTAGKWIVNVTPDGLVKPCPDLPIIGHYTDFKVVPEPIKCNRCWHACHGETEGSLQIGRILELIQAT